MPNLTSLKPATNSKQISTTSFNPTGNGRDLHMCVRAVEPLPRTAATSHVTRSTYKREYPNTIHHRTDPLVYGTSFKPSGTGRDTFLKSEDGTTGEQFNMREYPATLRNFGLSNINSIHSNRAVARPYINPETIKKFRRKQCKSVNRLSQPAGLS